MRPAIEIYKEKQQFVEKLNEVMANVANITNLAYKANVLTGDEVVRIKDGSATPFYVNVTGNSTQAILAEVCAFILNRKPTGLVESREGRTYFAKLFEGVA